MLERLSNLLFSVGMVEQLLPAIQLFDGITHVLWEPSELLLSPAELVFKLVKKLAIVTSLSSSVRAW
jgi:hypothetical protein